MGLSTGLPECSHRMSELREKGRRKLQFRVLEVTYHRRQECQESGIIGGQLGSWQPLREGVPGGIPVTLNLWRVSIRRSRTGFLEGRLQISLSASVKHSQYALLTEE